MTVAETLATVTLLFAVSAATALLIARWMKVNTPPPYIPPPVLDPDAPSPRPDPVASLDARPIKGNDEAGWRIERRPRTGDGR